jgi:hypothetical protein
MSAIVLAFLGSASTIRRQILVGAPVLEQQQDDPLVAALPVRAGTVRRSVSSRVLDEVIGRERLEVCPLRDRAWRASDGP